MSDAPSPTHSRWLRGLLVLLPVTVLAGWGVGQLPTRAPSHLAAPNRESALARTGSQAELSQWTSLSNAIAESQRSGKPVMIDFNAEWCGPCQAMKRTVFEDAENGRVVQTTVIPVSVVDRVREDGENPADIEALQRRYDINAFPTLIVFSPRTGKSEKARGFRGPDGTLAWITEAAKKVR